MMIAILSQVVATELFAQVVTYEVDPDESTFVFMVTHLGMMDVEGTFEGARGFIDVDMTSETPVRTRITLESATFSTGNESRDEEVRSEEILDTDRFPLIEFESSNFLNKEGTHIDAIASGELTIAGVTKTIIFPYTLSEPENQSENSSILIVAEFILSREEFDLDFGRILDAMVADDVSVSVILKGVLKD